MIPIKEGQLYFTFDDKWDIVINYDEPKNSDYAKYFQDDKVTAVDFIASKTKTSGTKQIVFIEVKDLRGHENKPENVEKLKDNANILTSVITKNVRDTIYGIVIGNRNTGTTNHNDWVELLNILKSSESQILVILWLEANFSVLPIQPSLHSILQLLKRKLNRFTSLVNVCSINSNSIDNLVVTSVDE